jgi:hypothetical protein
LSIDDFVVIGLILGVLMCNQIKRVAQFCQQYDLRAVML